MANNGILAAVAAAWSAQAAAEKMLLDLSSGDGATSEMLARQGYRVVATDYGLQRPMKGVTRVAGVDLNSCLPFQSASFDAVNLVEVIEHIENQPQLIREIARVLKPNGLVLISTPNVLNVMSRCAFYSPAFCAAECGRPTTRANPARRRIFICCIFTSFIICCFIAVLKSSSSERLGLSSRRDFLPVCFGRSCGFSV